VKKAVEVLTKEFEAHERDAINELRKTADYFVREPDGEVTVEVVLGALERQINRDLRVDSYVKWQLLSAVKERMEGKYGPRALAIYQRAPQVEMRPGMEEREKRQLSAVLPQGRVDSEAVDEINREWRERVFKAQQANDPILKYREELFGKLPLSGAMFKLGLQDAYTRVMRGFSSEQFVAGMDEPLRDWSREAKPGELTALAVLMENVANELGGKTPRQPEYLTQVRQGEKDGRLTWEKGRANFAQAKDVEDMVRHLHNRAENPPAAKK
jgi:hypothetical protein